MTHDYKMTAEDRAFLLRMGCTLNADLFGRPMAKLPDGLWFNSIEWTLRRLRRLEKLAEGHGLALVPRKYLP